VKIRIRCDLILDATDDAIATEIVQYLHKLKKYFRKIRAGEIAEESSFVQVEKCYHDENPSKPCEIVYSWQAEE